MPDCTRASVVYESVCVYCNPMAASKGELKEVKEGGPSLYVGESSRSIQERTLEHWAATRREDTDSHEKTPRRGVGCQSEGRDKDPRS